MTFATLGLGLYNLVGRRPASVWARRSGFVWYGSQPWRLLPKRTRASPIARSANPLPLGFPALAGGTVLLAALQLDCLTATAD